MSKSNAIQENDSTVEIVQFIDERTQKISQPVQEVLEQGEVVYLEDSAILLKKTKRATKANQSESSTLDRSQSTAGSVLILTQSKTEINRHKSRDCLFQDLSIHLVDLIQHELRTSSHSNPFDGSIFRKLSTKVDSRKTGSKLRQDSTGCWTNQRAVR